MTVGHIAVFGGTGFIGRHLVPALLREGWTVRIVARHRGRPHVSPDLRSKLKVWQADVRDDAAVDCATVGTDAVINLVGMLTETPKQSYRAIHVEAARRIAHAAQRHGATRLIHISALGASDTSPAVSDRTKAEGEAAARDEFPGAVIVRPSLVYGEGDHFFNGFAAMAMRTPVLPLIGGGHTKFQPVHIDDMTTGLLALLGRPDTAGRIYEFGGPEIYSFKELLSLLLAAVGRWRLLMPIPWSTAKLLAAVLQKLPNPPLTVDQVRLLQTDKVVSGRELTLADLSVHTKHLQEFLRTLRMKYR